MTVDFTISPSRNIAEQAKNKQPSYIHSKKDIKLEFTPNNKRMIYF